jgi:hypothetical protein
MPNRTSRHNGPEQLSRAKAHAVERLLRADRRLGEILSVREIHTLAATTESIGDMPSDGTPHRSLLTGKPAPPASALAQARRENLLRAFADRRALLANTLSTAEVAVLLGISRRTARGRVRAGALLAIADDQRRLRFPDWQFDADQPSGTIVGLARVLHALRQRDHNDIALARWFGTPKPLLTGRTPLDALRRGDIEDVIAEAEALGAT